MSIAIGSSSAVSSGGLQAGIADATYGTSRRLRMLQLYAEGSAIAE